MKARPFLSIFVRMINPIIRKWFWTGLFIPVICFACASKKNNADVSKDEIKSESKVNVVIKVSATHTYCGGAEPPEGILLELRTPRPLSGKWIYVRSGDINLTSDPIIDSALTNQNGEANFKLLPGNYLFVFEDKKDKTRYNDLWSRYAKGTESYSPIDKRCLDDWLRRPEKLFVVAQNSPALISHEIHIPCDWDNVPCSLYSGPLPP